TPGSPASCGCSGRAMGTVRAPLRRLVASRRGACFLSSVAWDGTTDDRTAAAAELRLPDVEHAGAEQPDADRVGRQLRLPALAAAHPRHRGGPRAADRADLPRPRRAVRCLS